MCLNAFLVLISPLMSDHDVLNNKCPKTGGSFGYFGVDSSFPEILDGK